MTDLFIPGPFKSHSGLDLDLKIDCDALSPGSWVALAKAWAKKLPPYSEVFFVPKGGRQFAAALAPYRTAGAGKVLIADDVLTTGRSMERHRDRLMAASSFQKSDFVGVVLFSRGVCPTWIIPIFPLSERFW